MEREIKVRLRKKNSEKIEKKKNLVMQPMVVVMRGPKNKEEREKKDLKKTD
jgi:hypothetical protein